MDLEKQLLAVEKQLWRNDAELYQHNLTPEALLVFPETGPALASSGLRQAKRFVEADISSADATQYGMIFACHATPGTELSF